jgi:predicted O-linked N-acetylglucosamine transferase (SPINDLY family)
MDYFLADPVLVPEAERALYAEEIVDLPCCICIERPAGLPETNALPALGGQGITFGCANRAEKITALAAAVWGRIMTALPGARLLIKDRGLDDAENRRLLLARLAEAGIAPARVSLLGFSPHQQHLEIFRRMDLALDPFPQGGGVSTAEALWMGVPVVALMGATPASRASAAMLSALGMADWVARDADEYAAIAVRACADLGRLSGLRESLRQRIAASPVGDPGRYCREVESAYRAMWRRWCSLR